MSITPDTAGPNRDGSRSLARESKVGQLVNGVVTTVALWTVDALGELDITGLPDVLEAFVAPVIGTAVGLISAWATKNRRAVISA